MNFTQLRCFIYVADNLSFTIAAQKLNFSQPAVSKNINELEKELKTKLLIRNPHKIALTEDGKYFYNVALSILKEKDSAIVRIKSAHQKSSFRDFNVGLDYSPFEKQLITTVLKQFEPGSFNFVVNYLGDYISQLADGKIDVALVTNDIIKGADEIAFEELLSGKFVIMFNQNSPYNFTNMVHLTELSNSRVFIPFTDQSYPCTFRLNQTIYRKLGAKNVKAVDNYFLMYNYVLSATSNVAILPNFIADCFPSGVCYRNLAYDDDFSYGIAFLARRKSDRLIKQIITAFKKSCRYLESNVGRRSE